MAAPPPPIRINRAPVVTLWATVVAGRLGYPPETALTVGRFVAGAGPNGDDLALHRLFLSRVGDNGAARGLFFSLEPTDYDLVVQRTELHVGPS